MATENNKKLSLHSDPGTLSIYGYTDYRGYLKDFYEFKKDSARGYSYRSFSKTAGFSSPNFLKLVIDGKRNISPEAIDKFIKALRLTPQMGEYFRALVKMNQSKSDDDKAKFYEDLKHLTPHAKRRELNVEEYQYLSSWLYPVLRELIELKSFRDDPYWIARRLKSKVNVSDITKALSWLVKAGFIEKLANGCYTSHDNMVLTSDEVKNLAIRNYHRQMLEQAKEALEELDVSEREFGALTFSLPSSALDELKFKLKNFRRDLHTWAMQTVSDSSGEMVVQVNLQMYPHTANPKKEEK
jgi:uncharacterized protein (TIGR02147 family)